jgi:hypothetical protein
MQSNLQSDNYCGYNTESAEFFWRFQPGQYENTFSMGEVGVPVAGGTGGSYIRADAIDISSFLEGRDTILSRCNPPIPSMDSINRGNLEHMTTPQSGPDVVPSNWGSDLQNIYNPQNSNPVNLIAEQTREKRSQIALGAIDYNRFDPGLKTDPQNLRVVIEDMWPQRGGLDTRNYTKSAWSNQNNVPNFDNELCRTTLDPSRYCGEYCSSVSGLPPYQLSKFPGKPPGQQDYPFAGITSQQVVAVGAAPCGPQFHYGMQYTEGSCPQ